MDPDLFLQYSTAMGSQNNCLNFSSVQEKYCRLKMTKNSNKKGTIFIETQQEVGDNLKVTLTKK